jgi:hypothetical protein
VQDKVDEHAFVASSTRVFGNVVVCINEPTRVVRPFDIVKHNHSVHISSPLGRG